MSTFNYMERYWSEITELRAFEAGAIDYLLMNYFGHTRPNSPSLRTGWYVSGATPDELIKAHDGVSSVARITVCADRSF
jgi:hypothetical protein